MSAASGVWGGKLETHQLQAFQDERNLLDIGRRKLRDHCAGVRRDFDQSLRLQALQRGAAGGSG